MIGNGYNLSRVVKGYGQQELLKLDGRQRLRFVKY